MGKKQAVQLADLGSELAGLAQQVGVGKTDLQEVMQTPNNSAAISAALDSLDKAVQKANQLARTAIDDNAKNMEAAALKVQIQADEVIADTSEVFQERVDAQNELHVL